MSDYVVPQPRISIPDHAPEAFKALYAVSRAINPHLDPVLAELVKLRCSQINGCAYCVDMHTRDALKAGEDERRLFAVSAWREAPFFTAKERAALALAESVTLVAETHVPDDVWEGAEKEFTPEELSYLLLAITTINTYNRLQVSSRALPRP
ncbi:MAG TPA: carboxymuconolactone decarboxylase family protein [Mycobacteriales bacterium]|jgi:AhpD family alkylhydroperoxidase|nr:carboxymuconolactone decarboxylase family protein [Mycobacteriales bacterium]